MYGQLNKAQEKVVKKFVRDKVVHDLGAGFCELSVKLIGLGAERVIAIDRKRHMFDCTHINLSNRHIPFSLYEDPIDIAFVSWPVNQVDIGLLTLTERARIVILLGKNTDGVACGFHAMYFRFLLRKLEAHVPDRKNTLTVYSSFISQRRVPVGEEFAALDLSRIYSYDEVNR